MAEEGFFQRWARRKAESGKQAEVAPLPEKSDPADTTPDRMPTIEDVKNLTADSDYSLFLAKGTDPAVRRAALKTLFSDPHFHAMDGLDVYIGDYTRADPLTPAMLAALQHARSVLPPAEDEAEQADEAQAASTASDTEQETPPDAHASPAPESDA